MKASALLLAFVHPNACKPDPPNVVRRIPRLLDFFLGGRLEFLRVGARESHPVDGGPWAEDPIGYANHRVDDAEVPNVAQDHPEFLAAGLMDNDLLANPRFGYAILWARADPVWYVPVCYGYTLLFSAVPFIPVRPTLSVLAAGFLLMCIIATSGTSP